MKQRKLLLVFTLILALGLGKTMLAQPSSSLAIALSEYCVSNIGLTGNPQSDYFGNRSDWVELKSSFSSVLNLSGYYLSNDPNNLFKWAFPQGFILNPGAYKAVWLTGKNTVTPNGEYHTNFTIEQCKNQRLFLVNSQGVILDEVNIRKAKEGHSWGRSNYSVVGNTAWRIFTASTLGFPNTGTSYIDYAPTPIIRPALDPLPTSYTNGINTGGFYPDKTGQSLYLYLQNGLPYDTLNSCFRIYYTLDNSQYPVPGAPGTTKLVDTLPIVTSQVATVIRAIAVPFSSGIPTAPSGCELDYLPSFCETNTYFTDAVYDQFDPNFGVVSVVADPSDVPWYTSSGAGKPIIHVEYYDKKLQLSEGYTQIERPVNEAWLTAQRGFYMTIDDRRGFGCNFEGDIFNVEGLGTSDRKIFPTLHLKAGDYESHSPTNAGGPTTGTAILDVFYQSLAIKNNLNVSSLHIKPVIVFKNGKYDGVYDLREVYDKHYEQYYNQQSPDSVDMMYFHGLDGAVAYYDGMPSNFNCGPGLVGTNSFANSVYTLGISPTINSQINYNKLFSRLDKASFIDYMILNSYAMNSNLWQYNLAFARGGQASKPGNKWHYYLWNLPSIFNFTALSLPGKPAYPNTDVSPCFVHTVIPAGITPPAGNSHGKILQNLMSSTTQVGGPKWQFQQEYKNRYQDLINGPLSCEKLLAHWDYVHDLYLKEMTYMENQASLPNPGPYLAVTEAEWDTNTVYIRRGLEKRCKTMKEAFGSAFVGCYGMKGPYPLTVNVRPEGAGKVKLNSITLDTYIWSGSYYATNLAFKATPSSENYVFDHWEFENHVPLNNDPISLDSVSIGFAQPGDNVVAVFTDKKNDISMPSGFTPNGDGINDFFKPVGSALYARDFDMSVWNRWGQEVFRTTDATRGWDGIFKGEQAQTGVYAYVITYKNAYNESKVLKGNITLLR